MLRSTRQKKPTAEKVNATEAGACRNLSDTAAMEDFASRIELDEEDGVLVLVVKEEPPDELSLPDEVKIETFGNVYTHQSDINNDTDTQECPDQDHIKEESEERSAEENQKYYSNPYDEHGHQEQYVEDGGRTCVQEELLECAEDANEEYSADQVRSPQQTELTEHVTEETYETHNPDVENFVLEKWLCGPHPDEEKLVELMMQPLPPLPNPLPYVRCEDSQEYRCIYCAYRNGRESLITKHYRRKHGPRYIYCFACGNTFSEKINLTKHEALYCKAAGIAVVRRVRRALDRSELKDQQWKENLSKNHYKKKEGYTPPVAQKLHRNVHRNTIPNLPKCRACGQEFADAPSLQLHQHLRRECRPFRCEFCPCSYTTRGGLTHHMEKHLTQKFRCEYCGKGFNKKCKLSVHLRSHVDRKRFKCVYCEACFSHNRSLMSHEAQHTGAPAPHICSICEEGFWRFDYLKAHVEKMHGMSIVTKKKLLKMLPNMSQEDREASELIKGLVQTDWRPAKAARAAP